MAIPMVPPHPHDVECVTCHLEGVHTPWMAAISIPLILALLDEVWRDALILGITVCRVSASHIQGVNTLNMGSKGGCRGWRWPIKGYPHYPISSYTHLKGCLLYTSPSPRDRG